MLKDPGMRVSLYTLIINIILSGYKMFVGVMGNSTAMVADAVHSFSDVFTTVIVMFSLGISKKPADKEHPYGHARAESIAAKVLGLALIVVAFSVAKSGISSLTRGNVTPSFGALMAAIISIAIKEIMYQVTAYVGRKQQSKALIADAWHHRSDALSSVGTMIGIFAARRGLYFMDGVGALIVSVLIGKMGWDIWKQTVEELMDTQKPEAVRELISTICQNEGVYLNDELLRIRHYGNTIFAEMTIGVPGNVSVSEGHEIAEKIRVELVSKVKEIEDVIIHVDPLNEHCFAGSELS